MRKMQWSLMLFMALPGLGQATPYLGAKCQIDVKAPENGAGVMFSEDCHTIYVLPPVAGQAKLVNLAQNANLQFCPAQLATGAVAAKSMQSAGAIATRIESMIRDYQPLEKELIGLRDRVAVLRANYEAAKRVNDDAEAESERKRNVVTESVRDYRNCLATATDGQRECEHASRIADEAKRDLAQFVRTTSKTSFDSFISAKAEYDRAFALLQSRNSQYTETLSPVMDLQNRIFDLHAQVFDLYKQYSPLEGVTGQILYEIRWDTLINGYRQANPDLVDVSWQRMPIKDARLSATTKAHSHDAVSLPAMLWASLPGAGTFGLTKLKPSSEPIGPLGPVPSAQDLGYSTIGFSNSVSGQVGLSLNGACAYFPKGPDVRVNAVDYQAFAAHMVANATYIYEVMARRGYTAHYNLSNFLSRVESNVKKGGFFSSSNVHKLVVDSNSSDWFEIKFDAEASEFQYSREEQDSITREVKAGLADRALRNIAVANSARGNMPGMPEMPKDTGAGALAKDLRNTCGFYIYCQVGSMILGTLNNIFGQTSAVSDFKQTNRVWVTEKVRGVQVLERAHAVTFDLPPRN